MRCAAERRARENIKRGGIAVVTVLYVRPHHVIVMNYTRLKGFKCAFSPAEHLDNDETVLLLSTGGWWWLRARERGAALSSLSLPNLKYARRHDGRRRALWLGVGHRQAGCQMRLLEPVKIRPSSALATPQL